MVCLWAGFGAGKTGFLGFFLCTKPVLADIFLHNRKIILGATGKVVISPVGVFINITFDIAFGVVRIGGLAAFWAENSQFFFFGIVISLL